MFKASESPPSPSPLYEGRSVPFDKLSASDFEKCIFACFVSMQSHQGLRIDGQPAGSGDGGFDVYGVALDSNRKLCVQCKRQKASLGLPLLAREMAKVALTSRLEKSDVGVHFFVCTGGVTQELRHLLRQTGRTELANAAKAELNGGIEGELSALRQRLVKAGDNPEEVVGSYVRTLDRLVAWDIEEFDAALAPAWDSAFNVLERFFKVSTAVREHPRALYARTVYQERCASFTAVVQPQLKEGDLPVGIVELSSEDPGPREQRPKKGIRTLESLATLAPGEVALVVAEAGAGKTTLLQLVRAEVAKESSSARLSVLINCSEYVPGKLDTAVHAQLGVRSGSWRMLPDSVQILCDGINEAPPSAVRALFGELKPLLESNMISCIFTSREDSRLVRAVLPTLPCATLRLLPLSPGRVRALAHHALARASEVTAFVDEHRRMATRTSGPFMWTPFAVRVALKRWKGSQQLGDTLGDLLEAIVSARADRDLEIWSQDSSSDIPKASVLAIASAIAFEMLVVGGQAACGAGEVRATFRRAMCLCSNVFGADGLTSNEFVHLLRKHDLVQRTSDESFQWTHQLVAGALAARHLAPNWRKHINALQQPLSDDAWVFATRLVPESEFDQYLGELFRADLMLGARATAELPLNERDRSLQHILKALRPGQPEELRATGLFALARVGTVSALSYLRELAKDRESDIGFPAARALAYSGDRPFLLELGAEVDRRRQMGWSVSGGDISIWEAASLADRIAIARERLSSVAPGEPVNESLDLVGRETSQEDIPLLEAHFRGANDSTAWTTALRAIQRGDNARAQMLLNETLSEATSSVSKAAVMTAGHKLGLAVDVDDAFSLLMDLSSGIAREGRDVLTRSDLAKAVLGELPLTEEIRRAIEDELPTSTGDKRSSLWQLACRVESPTLARVALDIFDSDFKEAGMAANFFLAHRSLREEHHHALQDALYRYLQDRSNWFTFGSWRTMVLAVELGLTSRTVQLLHDMILRLTEILQTAQNGTMPIFDAAESHIAQGFAIDSARIRLQWYVGFLVPGAVAATSLLPSTVLLKFLHFELTTATPGKEIVNVYRHMNPDSIDDELETVRDPWAQRGGLEMVCEFGLTHRRLELLRTHLKETYCHLAALRFVRGALEKCWNRDACEMVVATVAGFEEWPQEWQQVFWDFSHMVSSRVTGGDADFIERYIPLAKTPFARRILRIWRQATLNSRVGLSRLDASEKTELS